MNKIKAAIIEDEIPAGRLLHKMLSGLRPDWDIVVLPGSIEGSVKWFQEHPHPDIIFLDIQLTDGISFAFIEQAQPESMIIFTTAYDEYAIRAFTVNSIDYLLKPINRERLAEAIEKFERLTARYGNTTLSNSSNELLNLLKNISNPEKKYRTRFLISGDEKLYTLQVEDIAYFYSENKITFAVTKEGKEHTFPLKSSVLLQTIATLVIYYVLCVSLLRYFDKNGWNFYPVALIANVLVFVAGLFILKKSKLTCDMQFKNHLLLIGLFFFILLTYFFFSSFISYLNTILYFSESLNFDINS